MATQDAVFALVGGYWNTLCGDSIGYLEHVVFVVVGNAGGPLVLVMPLKTHSGKTPGEDFDGVGVNVTVDGVTVDTVRRCNALAGVAVLRSPMSNFKSRHNDQTTEMSRLRDEGGEGGSHHIDTRPPHCAQITLYGWRGWISEVPK